MTRRATTFTLIDRSDSCRCGASRTRRAKGESRYLAFKALVQFSDSIYRRSGFPYLLRPEL